MPTHHALECLSLTLQLAFHIQVSTSADLINCRSCSAIYWGKKVYTFKPMLFKGQLYQFSLNFYLFFHMV